MKPLAMTEDNFNAVIRAADPSATDIKTETRRLLTLKGRSQEHVNELQGFHQDGDGNWIGAYGINANDPEFVKEAYPKGSNQGIKSPLQIGDRAYLKEPTRIVLAPDQSLYYQIEYFWGEPKTIQKLITLDDKSKIESRKTGVYSKQGAMFMLKSFARHSVEILDVRVERLLDITDEGAIAEGIKVRSLDGVTTYWDYLENRFAFGSPKRSYISEIEMLHSKEIAAANPWLWVYKFKYLTGDDDNA